MNHPLEVILLVIAALSFILAVVNVKTPVNLVAVGLFTWVLTVLIPLLK